jgi:predicted nucleotidyltransferase
MLNHLLCRGNTEAKVISNLLGNGNTQDISLLIETNQLTKKNLMANSLKFSNEIFEIASKQLEDEQIVFLIQKWIYEEKTSHLLRLLSDQSIPLKVVAESLRKYSFQTPKLVELEEQFKSSPVVQGVRVALTRRLLSDQLEYVHIAKNYLSIYDFNGLLERTVITSEGIGRFGGKAAGMILAEKVISKFIKDNPHLIKDKTLFSLNKIRIPKTWFIPSDSFYDFLAYNNLEDIIEQKYKPIDEIRSEYANIIQVFKNSQFPPELVNGLARALDDFGDNPIIVRSSSLLEDRLGASFAGKYKSIFLANQGSKQERLVALMDAIAEVYASIFSPDPIGYRIEHNLLDFKEEMGIMLQEVVGKRISKYYFPLFAGVAFSYNDFRWSPRIEREDGLIRMVVGLGTRAVDRIGDDYPIIISPGKPNISVYTEVNEYIRYSPHKIDLINLDTNKFETVDLRNLLKEAGDKIPFVNLLFSIVEEHHLRKPVGIGINPKEQELVVTFDNLFNGTNFIDVINKILKLLESELGTPVDIEFAFNGEELFLLQCRSQSASKDLYYYEIPSNIPEEDIFFKTHKFVGNGKSPDIEYIVYVDPTNYSRISEIEEFYKISEAIGKLNTILPPKKFILIGPGRWGTRDDFRLGVKVTYSSISNTACLVEIAHSIGNYLPEVSFGTHFFQDLVESNILYIPIFPNEQDTFFNELFVLKSFNILSDLLPEYSTLSPILKVVSVRKETNGKILRVISNTDSNLAIGFLTDSSITPIYKLYKSHSSKAFQSLEEPWEIRWKFVEKMVEKLNPQKYGVKGVYLFGTVFSKTASETSDVDLLFYIDSNSETRGKLESWLEPWNELLKEIIYIHTGYNHPKPLDVYFITKEEINSENYYYNEIMNKEKKLSYKLL